MSVDFREARAADVHAIQSLVRLSFAPELHPYMIATQSGIEAWMHVFFAYSSLYPDYHFIVAESTTGELQGYAEFRILSESTAWLAYICVSPAARGRGVGAAIVRRFLAGNPSLTTVELDVFAGNAPAVALYQKLGFKHRTGDDHVWRVAPIKAQPATSSASLHCRKLHVALAALRAYGFCELVCHVDGREARIGLMGDHVLRCFCEVDYRDTRLHHALREVFPSLSEVLAVFPAAGASDHYVDRVINRTVRMRLTQDPDGRPQL